MTDTSWLPRDGTCYSLCSVAVLSKCVANGSGIFTREWVPTFPDKIKKTQKEINIVFFLIGSEIMVMEDNARNLSLSINFLFSLNSRAI